MDMEIKFRKGLSEQQVEDLIKHSNSDELVKLNTEDAIRFKDRSAYEKWQRVPSEIYTLTDNSNSLLGIIWLKPHPLPAKDYFIEFDKEKFGITFAIRLYEKARGKGYSEPFLEWAFNEYKKTDGYLKNPSKGIYLETRKDNLAAINLYNKFGFNVVSKPDENERVIMIQS